MASVLRLRRRRDVPATLRAAMRVRRQALASEGCLGLALRAEPLARRFTTLSAWVDEASIGAFVRAEPHATSMCALGGDRIASSTFVTWRAAGDEVPSWDDALDRLGGAVEPSSR